MKEKTKQDLTQWSSKARPYVKDAFDILKVIFIILVAVGFISFFSLSDHTYIDCSFKIVKYMLTLHLHVFSLFVHKF